MRIRLICAPRGRQKEIGGTITAQEFVDTPSFNRNFAGYLGMLPCVAT